MNKRAGITEDGLAIWAYSPGHVWAARRLAEQEAADRGLALGQAARSALIRCAPGSKPIGEYEVYVFELATGQ